ARALAAEQPASEQVLLAAAARRPYLRRRAGRPLELQQAIQHVDGRVEGGPHRSGFGLAVPAAVSKPFGDDPLGYRRNVHPEVRPGLDRPAVDARLDLTI